MKSASKFVIEDRPLIVLPKLACAIGLLPAIVLQQISFYLNNDRCGVELADKQRWIFNTYEQWGAIFPFACLRTVRQAIVALEELGLIHSCQPEGGISRRKYYRLADDLEEKLADRLANHLAKSATSSSGKIGHMVRQKRNVPITETSAESSQRGDPTGSASTHSIFLPEVAAYLAELIKSGEYMDPEGEARSIQGAKPLTLTLRHFKRALVQFPLKRRPELPPSTPMDDATLFGR